MESLQINYKKIIVSIVGLWCCTPVYGVRQRIIITNNSDSRLFICAAQHACAPLAMPPIDPTEHSNLYVPFASGTQSLDLAVTANYLAVIYQLRYLVGTKRVALMRNDFELGTYGCAAGFGNCDIPLVINKDLSIEFDTTWAEITAQATPPFPRSNRPRKFAKKPTCACTGVKEPFPYLTQRALAKRQTTQESDLPT